MAGRKVIVPKKISRVYGMSPVGTVLLYTLAPEDLIGWNYQPDPAELAYVAPKYRNLPVLGGWFGKNNTGNLEQIVKVHPDILISMGDMGGVSLADRVQQQTHIPVVVLDGTLKNLPVTYEKAGELLGVEAKANELAGYCKTAIEEIGSKVQTIPLDKRRKYYYAEGPTGLETEPGNTAHAESLDFAGGVNVATVPKQQGGYGHTPVSMEQVLKWNPQIVITGYDHSSSPGAFYQDIWRNAQWKRVDAVQHKQVYEAPQYPHSWIDRPPSANRIIGIKWLANLFYPELFPYDMTQETRTFYEKFYHIQLTNAQMDELLKAAKRNHD